MSLGDEEGLNYGKGRSKECPRRWTVPNMEHGRMDQISSLKGMLALLVAMMSLT